MSGSDTPHVIYCLVPRGTPQIVLDRLSEHYATVDSRVKVIRERRRRRSPEEEDPIAPPDEQRAGADRRRRVVPRQLPLLPVKLSVLVDEIMWVQHLVPVGEAMERMDAEQLFDAVRARHPEAPAELYWRWYARLHSRLSVLLGNGMTAERALAS